jgi:DNA-binding MarR family transcriptional regulator
LRAAGLTRRQWTWCALHDRFYNIFLISIINRKVKRPARMLWPLTPALFHILLALYGRERHGYDIMEQVKEHSRGAVKMGLGTLYGSLDRMIPAGLVTKSDARDPRRIYCKLTALRQATLKAESERLSAVAATARRHFGGDSCPSALLASAFDRQLGLPTFIAGAATALVVTAQARGTMGCAHISLVAARRGPVRSG